MRSAKAATWVLVSVLAGASCSKKQEIDLSAVAPFKNLFSEEETRKNFVNLESTPFNRDDLTFSLLVPKDWRDIPLSLPRKAIEKADESFIPICRQLAPEGEPGHPMIEVQFLKLTLELGLTDFVINYLEVNRLKPLTHTRGLFNGRRVEDVVIGTVQDGEDYVARMTFSRHGENMFVVIGSARSDYFMNWARHFGMAAVSFTPRRKAQNEFAEPMATFINPGPPYLEFRYPASWVRREPQGLPPGKVGTDVTLELDGTTFGYIHAKAVLKNSDISPEIALVRLKHDFEKGEISVGELLRESILDSSQPEPMARLQVWSAVHDGQTGELATLLLQNSSAIYSLGLLVPPREKNTLAWMTSWRVFEIVYQDVINNLNRPQEVSP